MINPEIDSEFTSLIPPLSTDEYNQLEANLLSEGCRDRLVLWGNILIDGHNRLQICEKHNIPYEVVKCEFADRDGAMKYIILNQFGRRNLSIGDRSLLALKLEPLYKAKAKENQRKSPGRGKKGTQNSAYLFSGETRKRIAEIAGVSHDTIDKVRKIVEDGTPEQVQRIKEGGKGNSVSAVYGEVRRTHAPCVGVPVECDEVNGGFAVSTNDILNEIQKSAVPPPVASNDSDSEGDNQSETTAQVSCFRAENDCEDEHQTPCSVPGNGDKTDEIKQIRSYVADLKNPGLDRSFTTEMFLAEYEAFTERFIRGIGVFCHEPYKEVYALLSVKERNKMIALGNAMIKVIEKQNLNVRNDKV